MSNIAKIKKFSIQNGEGIRTSVFFSGCEFYCKGCFNNELWDFEVGEAFTREVYETKIKPTITEHIAGISILGGEPLHPKNISDACDLVRWFKHDFPNKNVWLWTGYTIENLLNPVITRGSSKGLLQASYLTNLMDIVNYIDVLVDGQFIEEQKDLTLKWRGSRNQRVINIQETLKQNKVVLYENQ